MKWTRDKVKPWLVVDDAGTVMAECDNPDQAETIIREHNSHAALLEIARESLEDATCITWKAVIQDAIDLAEATP